MDTNYLLKREQVSLMMADRAVTIEARQAHVELAKGYGRMLVARQFPHRSYSQMPCSLNDNADIRGGRASAGMASA